MLDNNRVVGWLVHSNVYLGRMSLRVQHVFLLSDNVFYCLVTLLIISGVLVLHS